MKPIKEKKEEEGNKLRKEGEMESWRRTEVTKRGQKRPELRFQALI